VLDNDIHCRTINGLLLKCLGSDQSKIVMGEVHEGICGIHQSAHKMKWLLHRICLLADHAKRLLYVLQSCESCQKFIDVQLAHASMLHPIIKSWLFREWDLDIVGQIYHASSKGHRFMLIATDYFT
jgi:hypothetical protein